MNLTRRGFLHSSALCASTTLAGGLSTAAQPQKPNVLFVLADQWRASALGSGSDEVVRTPHLDRFAAQGVNCRRAYAANPVCTPNRSCILTGRFSHQNGMISNDLMLPPSEVCWPETYRDAGYATHYIGKWHLDGTDKPGYVPPGWRRRGFSTFEGFNRGHVYHRHWGFDDAGQPLQNKWKRDEPYYEPTLQTDLAIEFIRSHRSQPFCCYLSWGPPHTPFSPPDRYDLYTPGEIRNRPNVPQDHRARASKELAGYYGLCESLDHEMGRLLGFLDESGLADNTLVIFTADHGELAGSHGKYRKGEPEEESLNVPLLMRLPGRIAPGVETHSLINSIDLMPTLLSLTGLETPETCVGRDMSGAVRGEGASPSAESIYCEGKLTSADAAEDEGPRRRRHDSPSTWRTLMTDQYKLTVRAPTGEVEQLIDLKNDPFEMENLAGLPKHAALQKDLLAEFRGWARRTGDSFPTIPKSAKTHYSDEEAERARVPRS